MYEKSKKLYAMGKEAHTKLYAMLAELKPIIHNESSMEELADAAYVMHCLHAFADDLKKEFNAVKEHAIKLACQAWVDGGTGDIIRTPYISSTPDFKMMVRLPTRKREPDAWRALMLYLGVPENRCRVDGSAARQIIDIDWPGLVEHITECVAEGKPLPPGCDPNSKFPIYKLPMRGRKEPDADLTPEVESPF